MVEGFKIDISSTELCEHLKTQIQHHTAQVGEWEQRLGRLRASASTRAEVRDAGSGMLPVHDYELQQAGARVALHKQRVSYLTFVVAHIIPNETYRLGEDDMMVCEFVGDLETVPALGYHRIARV